MSIRFALVALLLAPAASAAPACSDLDGWNAGRSGEAGDAACTAESYAEAHRLGEALADLETRRAAFDARIEKGDEDIGMLRRRQRQIDVDIEAIHGVATLRGWPVQLLSRNPEQRATP